MSSNKTKTNRPVPVNPATSPTATDVTQRASQANLQQLGLFAPKPPPEDLPTDRLVAPPLPTDIHLGTSSWNFEGWKGLVYPAGHRSKKDFMKTSLGAYARHPLFTTVGIDASYYNPLTRSQLAHYGEQLPESFRALEKVWDAITTSHWPHHPRYGARGGKPNPHYLDAGLFQEAVLQPNLEVFAEHLGPLLFEFPPLPPQHLPTSRAFCQDLDRFFSQLPRGPLYAVELRNRSLFTPRYLRTLRDHNVCHCVNLWTHMPTVKAQQAAGDIFTGPALVMRLMLAPGHRYSERVQAWSPFRRLHTVEAEHRKAAVDLVWEAHARAVNSYLIVNNKFEGCSPLSVHALAEAISRRITESS